MDDLLIKRFIATLRTASKWDFIWVVIFLLMFLSGIILFSYSNPVVRLEHFSFLFGIVGSMATAATLIWLVIERNQLQKEKLESEKRKQAAGISTWLSSRPGDGHYRPAHQIIVFNNNSNAPIYNVVVSIVDARDKDAKGENTPNEFQRIVDTTPPGKSYCIAPIGYSAAGLHPSIEIAFSDANGNHWTRRGNGRLEELPNEPFVQYEVSQPPTYETLHSI